MMLSACQQPWDMAGADGLVAARALFGEAVDQLAPFQSMETALEGEPCAVLRLCDRNFRVSYPGLLAQQVAGRTLTLWVKQLDWMGAMILPADCLSALTAQSTVKAPHRLYGLPLHCAVPARVRDIPVLIWHHPVNGRPVVELHLASGQIETMCSLIRSFNDGSVSLTTAPT